MSADPRVEDSVGRFKAWMIGSSRLSVPFNPVIFFRYSFIVEDDCVTPKEVLEVKRAGGDLSTFV